MSSTSLDQIIVSVANELVGPISMLLTLTAYGVGTWLGFHTLHRILKHTQDGPRAPTGMGTVMSFVASAVLISVGDSMSAITQTAFGTSTAVTFSGISYTGNAFSSTVTQANAVISAVFRLVQLLGWCAFMRAWMLFRARADGDQHINGASPWVHLVGGVAAVNIVPVTQALQSTLQLNLFT